MGKSDPYIFNFYKRHINPKGETALLGWTNNYQYKGDLYDLQLGNWNINSDWSLKKKYDTIICTRTAYFAKNPELFINKCYNYLNENGLLYVDWGLGDHWRFDNYKVGWVKDNEREWAYSEQNFLWSTVWHDDFLNHPSCEEFQNNIKKLNYTDLKEAVHNEIPKILKLEFIKKYFSIQYDILSRWKDRPQLYILIYGAKK